MKRRQENRELAEQDYKETPGKEKNKPAPKITRAQIEKREEQDKKKAEREKREEE